MAISDLTNTTWIINSSGRVRYDGDFNINFTSNNTNYTKLTFYTDDVTIIYGTTTVLSYDDMWDYQASGWKNDAYRTVVITGGTDATNSNLIEWFEQNAVQQVKRYISSIKSNNEKYYVKDSDARTNITNLIEEQVHANVEEDDTLVFTVGTTSLLTFTGTNIGSYVYGPYQFEQGMTFEQWVASAYNTDGWTINASNRIVLGSFAYLKLYSPSQFVVKTDLVQAINYFVWLDN